MKIIVTNLFFGKKPGYFDIFLMSCAKNPKIDFLFLVDFETPDNIPANIQFIKTTFQEIQAKFQAAYQFPISLKSPYKLTDFQPAYGELLSDYFTEYDWWGHCDFDMIFGDLNPIIEVIQINKFVKIFRRGHLTLYKNSADINNVYKQGVDHLHYQNVFSTESFCNFDETNGIDKIFAIKNLPVYREELIADIKTTSPFLFMTAHANKLGQYFVWESGKLYCKNNSDKDKEYIYIHFQKRLMSEHYTTDGELPNFLFINQFGLFTTSKKLYRALLRAFSFLPNLAHTKRYYLPRIVKKAVSYIKQ